MRRCREMSRTAIGPRRVPPPVAFKLDERMEMYELLDGFDHAAWQRELEGDLRGGRGGLGGSPQMTANDRDDYVRRIHRELILGHGEEPYRETELCKAIRAAYGGLSARQADLIVMSLTGQAPGTRELAEELGIKCWSRDVHRHGGADRVGEARIGIEGEGGSFPVSENRRRKTVKQLRRLFRCFRPSPLRTETRKQRNCNGTTKGGIDGKWIRLHGISFQGV